MTEWALLWGAAAVITSVITFWYGRSWWAVAEASAQQPRSGSRPPGEAVRAAGRPT